jgi:lysylphosphatidylglycerol synthetase-like protein (DUF2156 family)
MFKSFYDLFTGWFAFLMICLVALVMGLILAILYKATKRVEVYSKAMPFALLLLPLAMSAVLGLVNLRNGEIEASDAVRVGLVVSCGIALTRFRSEPMKIEDLVYIVLSTVLGIVLGIGYVAYAAIAFLLFAIIVVVFTLTKFGENKNPVMMLRVQIPESLNWEDAFKAPLDKYCQSYKLMRTKTVDYGQLYEASYNIVLKKGVVGKQLVDEVRSLNGNLQIVLSDASYKD